MTHKPRNPYCEACVRAKLTHVCSYRHAHENTSTKWERNVTGDHITSLKERMLGVTGDRDAFTIREEYSGLRHLYPTKTKNAEETIMKIRHFCGDRKIGTFYSDNSGEIKKALK